MNRNDREFLVDYIRKILYQRDAGEIDRALLPEEDRRLAEALEYLAECVGQTGDMARALADGCIDAHFDVGGNPLAAPLKSIQSNLKNLAWTADRVAMGDYNQRVLGMGRLTEAFDRMSEKLRSYSSEMERLVGTDYLTGIGNRRSYNQAAGELWSRKQRFAVAFVDMDGLKDCNDLCGHAEGDAYILEVCRMLTGLCRDAGEEVFRLGGDEFLLLTRSGTATELEIRLETAREEFRNNNRSRSDHLRDFSFGCVDMDPTGSKNQSELLSIADQKMYNAKTIHYMRRIGADTHRPEMAEQELDRTGLDSRIFAVFANSAQNRYLFLRYMLTNVSRWSPQAVQEFDMPGEYMQNAVDIWARRLHPDDRETFWEDLNAMLAGRRRYHKLEYRVRNREGSYVICSCIGGILKGTDGEPDLFAGTITNHGIVDNIDPVTNLHNVYEFLKQLRHRRSQHRGAKVLCIAVHQFSDINNAYGYETGSQTLQSLAKKLTGLVRGSGRVFRLDGAKFAMFLDERNGDEIDALYRAIAAMARTDVYADQLHISLSVCGAFLQFDSIDVSESIIYSELMLALNQSKKARMGGLVRCGSSRDSQLRREMVQLNAVKQSVLNDCQGFFLMYQPQVDRSGAITGVEALLRWESPEFGLVPPSSYIPALENDICFYDLGLWIMKTAMQEIKGMLRVHPALQLSVNISYRQMEHYGFRDDVLGLLRHTGFPAENLTLELTEHCQTMNPDMLQQDIAFFKSRNIRIAADDFGTGYSSFSLMRQLPFDCIKIDQSFIAGIMEDKRDQIMVESVITCARKMGFTVCIEGVENAEVLEFVRQYGAEYYQGYHFSRPLRLEKLLEYVGCGLQL